MSHVMLDLETMSTRPDAAIVAIGAVHFGMGEIYSRFYRVVALDSSVLSGGHIEAGTVIWWLSQSPEARQELTAAGSVPLPQALTEFAAWLPDDAEVWGNGAAFDNVVLRSSYERCGMPAPWPFYRDRCYRTLKALHPEVPFVRLGAHHRALDDAESQAMHLMAILTPAPVDLELP